MYIQQFLLLLATLANILLGTAVWIRGHRKLSSWFFALTMLGVALWAIGDLILLSAQNQTVLLFGERLFYAAPMFIPATLLLFALTFPDRKLRTSTIWWVATPAITGAVVIFLQPSLLVRSIDSSGLFNIPVPNTPVFVLYAAYFSIMFCLVYVALFTSYRHEQRPLARSQLLYTFNGAIAASIPALLTNLSLPIVGKDSYIWLGPLFTTIFVVVIAINIVRNKMFDIRSFVVRSVAYLATILVLAASFGIVTFGIIRLVFDFQVDLRVQVFISLCTALAAVLFGSIKAFFDRMTNRLFYQDAYDAQALLDSLNRVLVASTDSESLLLQSAQVIADSFKADYCFFVLPGHVRSERRSIGVRVSDIPVEDIVATPYHGARVHEKVIITDELGHGQEELREKLQRYGVAVLGHLTPNTKQKSAGLGYLVLGARRSGNPYTDRDMRTLSIIVNELVIAIENSLRLEEIRHFNTTLQENVGEATRKLRRTNEKLRALDETKDDFITMASHQLRTPLTSVKGYLSMVLEGDVGKLNAQQRQLLTQSYLSSQRMVYLISDLLNLSRLNTGKFVIDLNPVDLGEIVQSELDQLYETARAREVTLLYDRPSGIPRLMLDETKVRQVVMNLIDNAIYYTPAGGQIQVEVRTTKTAVEFRVVDNGIGVPRAVQHRLFTKFYRAENAQAARPDGTGLGLFMAKKVVVAQGGAIIFTSEEGKGSTFGFRFTIRDHVVEK